ncbi:MAG: hypothetical protein KG003_08120 [Bacteroidetes bacterium]|nr:hypothetical protein [Bacteroidota bacterium]
MKQQLSLSKDEKLIFDSFLKAYRGDYWRSSKGFLGPLIAQNSQKMFKDRFVSRNIIGEIINTISDSFLKSPNWYIEKGGEKLSNESDKPKIKDTPDNPDNPDNPETPPPDNPEDSQLKDTKDKIDKILSKFWEKQNLEQKLQKAFNSRLVASRGGLRVYIPNSKKKNLNKLSLDDIRTCLDSIRIEHIKPERSRMMDDEGDKLSIVSYTKKLDYDTNEDAEIIEFSFVDDNGKTIIGVVSDKQTETFSIEALASTPVENRDTKKKDISTGLNLDSETTFFEISGEPFVSEQLMELSAFLNLVLTLAAIGIFETGFQEIITTNTQFKTEKILNEKTGKMEDVPVGLERGGAMIQNFKGIEKIDLESGKKERHEPKVTIKDPVPMENFVLAKQIAYESCLEEAGQQYKLISGDAMASAVSRIQAMAGFYLRIKKFKADIDSLGSWVLTTILKFIGLNPKNGLDDFRVVFDSKIDIGPLTPEEKNFIISMVNNKIISKETARVLLNIDNPTLENLLIENEEAAATEKEIGKEKKLQEIRPANSGFPPSNQ